MVVSSFTCTCTVLYFKERERNADAYQTFNMRVSPPRAGLRMFRISADFGSCVK